MGSPLVVIASEMGGGWGHLLPIRAIAREFIRRGRKVIVLAREAEKAGDVFAELGIEVVPTPAWTVRKTGFSLNYAQCVWANGYWEGERFQTHFAWWIERFRVLKPRFVLTDFSPTALLAARIEGMPRGAVGTGFTLPPPIAPMPSFHPWLKLGQEELGAAEAPLVAAIREACPDFHAVADLFAGAERFLTVFPELDHFADRPNDKYWGPVLEGVSDGTFDWPMGEGPRVFLYLGAGNRCLTGLLDHIRRLGLPAIGHIRGLPESDRRALESPTLKLSGSLIDIRRAAREADLAVTQGGMNTTTCMLLAGVPILICPEQLEQALLAYHLNGRGLCEWLPPWSDPNRVGERFNQVLHSQELAGRAVAFAEKHAGYESAATVAGVVGGCLEAAR
jgi:hypothetical protein